MPDIETKTIKYYSIQKNRIKANQQKNQTVLPEIDN